jgi:hypothetical protein
MGRRSVDNFVTKLLPFLRRVVLVLSEVCDSFISLEVIGMVCIFCDVPREKHTPAQLDECVQAGADGGWIGLSQF